MGFALGAPQQAAKVDQPRSAVVAAPRGRRRVLLSHLLPRKPAEVPRTESTDVVMQDLDHDTGAVVAVAPTFKKRNRASRVQKTQGAPVPLSLPKRRGRPAFGQAVVLQGHNGKNPR